MKTFSHLSNKSDLLLTASKYLHDMGFYPALLIVHIIHVTKNLNIYGCMI